MWNRIKNTEGKYKYDIDSMIDEQIKFQGVLTLLHTSREREDIRNWRPLTLLNSEYKIIAKILAERLKVVLPKLIHSDQEGFVKGRNLSEANRLIQDVI